MVQAVSPSPTAVHEVGSAPPTQEPASGDLASASEAPPVRSVSKADAPPVKELDASGIASVFPLEGLGSIPQPTAAGSIFRLDNGFLDALRLETRRIETTDGKPGYQLDFVIGGPSRPAMDVRVTNAGSNAVPFEFVARTINGTEGGVTLKETEQKLALTSSYGSHPQPGTKQNPHLGLRLEGLGWQVDYMPHDGPAALRGHMRIRMFGSDDDCQKALKHVIKTLGLQPAFSPPTPQSIKRYALMKMLWRTSPQKARELIGEGDLTGLKIKDLEAALTELGVEKSRLDNLRYQQVAPGHFTIMDDQTVQEMKDAGFVYAYSTVASTEHLHSILTGGQKSTMARWSEGLLFSGMSSMADVGSGGALGVFSRLVTDTAASRTWGGRSYLIIM